MAAYAPPQAGEVTRVRAYGLQTANTASHCRGADSARGVHRLPPSPRTEGAGKAGCALHPRSRVLKWKKRTRAYRFSGGNPAFPARWFTAYFELSSVIGLS